MARGREAHQEVVLQAFTTSWTGVKLSPWRPGQKARPPATHHLGALHFAVDTLASVAFFLPAAAMRKLKSSIVTRLPNANKLLALRSGATKWADTSEAIDLIHTGGTVGAG